MITAAPMPRELAVWRTNEYVVAVRTRVVAGATDTFSNILGDTTIVDVAELYETLFLKNRTVTLLLPLLTIVFIKNPHILIAVPELIVLEVAVLGNDIPVVVLLPGRAILVILFEIVTPDRV